MCPGPSMCSLLVELHGKVAFALLTLICRLRAASCCSDQTVRGYPYQRSATHLYADLPLILPLFQIQGSSGRVFFLLCPTLQWISFNTHNSALGPRDPNQEKLATADQIRLEVPDDQSPSYLYSRRQI